MQIADKEALGSLTGPQELCRDFVSHPAKFRSQRTETVAAPGSVAGSARLLKLGGNLTDYICPDCLGGSFQPMRCGGKLGEIARTIGCIDDVLRLCRTVAKFDK